MYKVTTINNNIGYTIYNSSSNRLSPKITNTSIVQGINSISSFTFTIYPNNPVFNILYPYSSKIFVYNKKKNKYIFKGRVLKIKPSMSSNGLVSKTIICEDRLGYLQDSIQIYLEEKYWEGDETRTGLEEFIDYILDIHNSQVEEEKKIYRGIVNVKPFTNSDNITKGLNYETTWNVIKTKLIDSFGGEIQIRDKDNKMYLDYLTEIGEEKSTAIELKKNMQSIDREIDPTSFITKLIPLGAKIKKEVTDESGNISEKETDERLTISDVNNGSIYLESEEREQLGSIVNFVTFDDVTDSTNLYNKAKKYLEENNKLLEKTTTKALDLSIIKDDVDEFEVGNYHPIKNKLIDLDDKLRIIKRSIDIIEPLSSTFDLGDSKKLLSSLTVNNSNKNIKAIEEIKKDYVPNVRLVEQITKLTSLIKQTAENITLEVSENYTLKSDYKAEAQRLANLIIQVNSIQQTVSTWSDLTSIIEGTGIIELNNAIKGNLIYMSLKGQIDLLYPSDDIYPSNDIYPINNTIVIEYENGDIKEIELPFEHLNYLNDNIYDEFIVDGDKTYIITRVGIDENNNFYQLEEEKVKQISNFSIILEDGTNRIYLPSFKETNFYIKYVVKNAFSDIYATTAQLQSSITQLAESINLTVSKKVDSTEIISTINQTAEEVKILANKLSFEGATLDMTANNIKILGDNLEINSNGTITIWDDGAEKAENVTASYIVKSDNKLITESGNSELHMVNKITSLGSNTRYDSDNKITGSTGYGTSFGSIIEQIFKYPSTTWTYGSSENNFINTSVGTAGITIEERDNDNWKTYFSVDSSGIIKCVSLSQTSLESEKKNIEILKDALSIIKDIDIYRYNLKNEQDGIKKHIGFIIGDKYKYSKDITNNENNGVDIYSMISLCLKAIKEQQQEIDSLKSKI